MRKYGVIAALTTATLGLGSLTAQAGMTPAIGEAMKSAADESKVGVVDQVYWRHRHRRAYVYIVPRYYGYRYYGRRW